MGNTCQFIQVERRDPAKKSADVRIKEYREIYAGFDQARLYLDTRSRWL